MPTIVPKDMNAITTSAVQAHAVAPPKVAAEVRQPDTSVDATKAAPETPKEDPNAAKLAELAKREKRYAQMRKELEDREKALASREAEIQSASAYRDSLKSKLAQNPLETLQSDFGITYDQLTNSILNQPTPQDLQLRQLKNEIEAMKKAGEAAQKAQAEASQAQYQQALQQLRTEVNGLVESNPADYETIKAEGAEEAVVALIEETFKQKGQYLRVEDAAKQVEEFLVEEGLRLAKYGKIQAKLKPPADPPQEVAETKLAPAQPKTLTNNVSQMATKPLTAKERRERAIAAMEGRLG